MEKIVLAIVCILMFASCSSGPEKAAIAFAEDTIKKGKYDEAKKYATESTGKMLDLSSAFGGTSKLQPNASFKAKTDSIDGNKAWVTLTVIDGDGNETEKSFDMVKIDGDWKVYMDIGK